MSPDTAQAGALIDRLERMPAALRAVVGLFAPADAAWRPDGASWSVLEIVCHLVDEEREDFRARLRSTLDDPARPWTPIDPEGWAEARRYAAQDLGERLDAFDAERAASVAWLRSLAGPDWHARAAHPSLGAIHAGDLLAAWADHDALHLRQIAKRLHQLAARDAGPFGTGYAGSW